MTDSDKPFICYKNGLSMKIVPRGRAGWIAIGLWVLSVVPLCVGFALLMSTVHSGGQAAAYSVGFMLAMTIWAIAMIVWTKNRSEVVDMEELLKLKRELDARKGRGR